MVNSENPIRNGKTPLWKFLVRQLDAQDVYENNLCEQGVTLLVIVAPQYNRSSAKDKTAFLKT